MSDRIRTTISISPEVHEIFKRMAQAGNMSVSRAMGEWLADTSDAAQLIVIKMEEAKRAPLAVMLELQAAVAGLSDAVDITTNRLRAGRLHGQSPDDHEGDRKRGLAPSSNTGLKSPPKGRSRGKNL